MKNTQKDKILPSKLGIIKFAGNPNAVQVNNYKFGDNYIKAMSEGIKKLPNVSVFKLAGNRITENGANTLFE